MKGLLLICTWTFDDKTGQLWKKYSWWCSSDWFYYNKQSVTIVKKKIGTPGEWVN